MNRVTLPKISPTLKLALLLTAFAMLNLAPTKEDCCRNEEEGDDEPKLFSICAVADPTIEDLVLDAGATATVHFKQTDCGNPNSTFLVPRPWKVKSGPGITITNQSVSGSRLSVTFKVTEHPEVYSDFSSYNENAKLLSSLYAEPEPTGLAGLVEGELKIRAALVFVGIRPAAGTDVPWSRSDARNAPQGPRIQVNPVIPFYRPVNTEAKGWFTIYNRGKANLDIHSITLEEQGDKWFRLDPANAAPPYYLPPGGFHDPWILCKPLYVGTKGATLVITSNDPTFPVVRTSVKGTGYVP